MSDHSASGTAETTPPERWVVKNWYAGWAAGDPTATYDAWPEDRKRRTVFPSRSAAIGWMAARVAANQCAPDAGWPVRLVTRKTVTAPTAPPVPTATPAPLPRFVIKHCSGRYVKGHPTTSWFDDLLTAAPAGARFFPKYAEAQTWINTRCAIPGQSSPDYWTVTSVSPDAPGATS